MGAAKEYEATFAAKGQKVCTIIAGSGPDDAIKLYHDMAAKELGLQHCYFVGPQKQPVLAKLYAVSSVGCFPSKAEPFGLVFVECMACECPVVGANSGGPIDFVGPDVGVLVPEPGGYEAAEDWKASKGARCLALARERFGVETQVTRLLQSAIGA